MFERLLNNLINMTGVEDRDIEQMLRSSNYLTNEQLFILSRFFQKHRAANIFFSKKIGFIKVSIKFLKDNIIEYCLNDINGSIFCILTININNQKQVLKFNDIELELFNGLKPNDNSILDNRIIVLNEILVRFFVRLIIGIYNAYKEEW